MCGLDISAKRADAKFCSRRCKHRSANIRQRVGWYPGKVRRCQWCGCRFDVPARGPGKLSCSVDCATAHDRWSGSTAPLASKVPQPTTSPPVPTWKKHRCAWCLWGPLPNRLYCSPLHADATQGRRTFSSRIWVVTCFECDHLFVGRSSRAKFCSASCRRAHRTGGRISAKVRRLVMERDEMMCHLCGSVVDPDDFEVKEGSDGRDVVVVGDWYPTMDHLVPKSKGGLDDMDNLSLAHHRCNYERGDTLIPLVLGDQSVPMIDFIRRIKSNDKRPETVRGWFKCERS